MAMQKVALYPLNATEKVNNMPVEKHTKQQLSVGEGGDALSPYSCTRGQFEGN